MERKRGGIMFLRRGGWIVYYCVVIWGFGVKMIKNYIVEEFVIIWENVYCIKRYKDVMKSMRFMILFA